MEQQGRNHRSLGAAALLALAVVLPARAAPAGPDAAQQDRPDLIYRNYCSVCHGERGDGSSHARQGLIPPPRDFTTPQAREELTRERMVTSVSQGRPGTAMVAWKDRLSERQIEAVVDYIRNSFMQPGTAASGDRGRAVYASTCSVCHGDQGRGAQWASTALQPPPRDFTSELAHKELTRERMLAAVTHGRPGTAMTAFASQLSRQDIEAVVDYIRTAFMAAGTPAGAASAAADMELPMPQGLSGDIDSGRAFYLRNCTACHGENGDGNGPRAYFIVPRPRNFLEPRSRAMLNRPALFQAVKEGVPGREMPAWGTVLSDQQIADVSEFVFRRFVRPARP